MPIFKNVETLEAAVELYNQFVKDTIAKKQKLTKQVRHGFNITSRWFGYQYDPDKKELNVFLDGQENLFVTNAFSMLVAFMLYSQANATSVTFNTAGSGSIAAKFDGTSKLEYVNTGSPYTPLSTDVIIVAGTDTTHATALTAAALTAEVAGETAVLTYSGSTPTQLTFGATFPSGSLGASNTTTTIGEFGVDIDQTPSMLINRIAVADGAFTAFIVNNNLPTSIGVVWSITI